MLNSSAGFVAFFGWIRGLGSMLCFVLAYASGVTLT